MPRTAKLGQKRGYWYSQAGGRARYFGRVGEIPYADALQRFREAVAKPKPPTREGLITVDDLTDRYLSWLKAHRGKRTHYGRILHLRRFAAIHGPSPAIETTADDLQGFLSGMGENGASVDLRHKHEASIRAAYRWGVRYKHLPEGFAPFATLEPIRPPVKALLESDLPTADQVRDIFSHAGPNLSDFLAVQHATGARTGELYAANVGEYQPRTRQIVLQRHKRETTMREPIPRVITLNGRADEIVSRLCQGRSSDEPIFRSAKGRRWRSELMSHHWKKVRVAIGLPGHITPYSFRHLWISEALMAGLDTALVAKMAGTSIAMIEKVYGRFRVQTLAEAQAKLDAARS